MTAIESEMDTPRDIYLHPHSLFAAQFVGLTNVLPAKWVGLQDRLARLDAAFTSFLCRHEDADGFTPGARAMILIRPENVLLSFKPPHDGTVNVWTGRIVSTIFLGDYVDCKIACGDTMIRARVSPFIPVADGAEVYLHVPPERCSIIRDAASGQ
jgi:ABC-type Fe3+/spermidine/putrescine transport system ATPase subunit